MLDTLKYMAPTAKDEVINPLVIYLNKYMPQYEVNSYLRVCHFLAQAAHESASFRTLEEYASGAAYEGRKDLGNTYKGDGVRYKGRGIFQLTGRANYRSIGAKIGKDLENNPTLAATPEVSVLTALEYWKSRKLNDFADKDDVETITRKINGGLNGYDDRKKYLSKIKNILPRNFKFDIPPPAPVDPLIPAITVAKIGDNSPYISDLQTMLIRKGAVIKADGAYGPATQQAVKDFQLRSGLKVTGTIDTDTLNRMMV